MTSSSTGTRMVVAACCFSSACWSSSSWKVPLFTCCFTSSISVDVSRVLSSICFFWSHSHCSVHLMLPLSFHCWCILFWYPLGLSLITLPCSDSTLLPYSGYVTIVFASSALVGHRFCLAAQEPLMCSKNLAWSDDPLPATLIAVPVLEQ